MTIANLPVWRFQPDWGSQVTETLEWLTEILSSPTGAEQRRALRYLPRRFFEFETVVDRAERSLLDNLLMSFGARSWWLPLWHDPHAIKTVSPSGTSSLLLTGALISELAVGDPVLIFDQNAFEYELCEIEAIADTGITFVDPTTKLWRPGALVYPLVQARLVEQPKLGRRSDAVVRAPVKFLVDEPATDDGTFAVSPLIPTWTNIYRSFSVLTAEPDDSQTLDFEMIRLLEELDNDTSVAPYRVDTADRPFTSQQHSWYIQGRQEHVEFNALLRAIRGRVTPFWLPTFYSDFTLVEDGTSGDETLTVASAGFTEGGGPRSGRRDIRILLTDGTSVYRRIVDSAQGEGIEVLAIDKPLSADLLRTSVQQISFIVMARLDQDSIEVQHQTDMDGVARVSAILRNAPEIRAYGVVPDGYFALTNKDGSLSLTNKGGIILLIGHDQ